VVYPAPVDMAADTTATITVPGKKFVMPDPPVKSKWMVEHYNEDAPLAQLAVECRFSDMKVTGDSKIATIDFNYMGRQLLPLDTGSSPFFTDPTGPTTSPGVTLFGGFLLVNGIPAYTISKTDFTVNLKGSVQDLASIKFVPEIFTGTAEIKGSFDAMLIDNTYKNLALNETTTSLVLLFTTADSPTADFISFFFPSVKLGQFSETGSGEGGISVTYPFTSSQQVTAAGYDTSMMTVVDSLAA
jgi:hypothetical protein